MDGGEKMREDSGKLTGQALSFKEYLKVAGFMLKKADPTTLGEAQLIPNLRACL